MLAYTKHTSRPTVCMPLDAEQQNKAAYKQEQLTTYTSPKNIYDEITRICIDCDEYSTY